MPFKYEEKLLKREGQKIGCVVLQHWQDVGQGQAYNLASINYFVREFDDFDDVEEDMSGAVSGYTRDGGKPALKAGKMPDDHDEIHARFARLMDCAVGVTSDDNHDHIVAKRDLSAGELQALNQQLQTMGCSVPDTKPPAIIGQLQSN